MNRTQENNLKRISKKWVAELKYLSIGYYMEVPTFSDKKYLELKFNVIDSTKLFNFVIARVEEGCKLFDDIFYTNNEVNDCNLTKAIEDYGKKHSLDGTGLENFKMKIMTRNILLDSDK